MTQVNLTATPAFIAMDAVNPAAIKSMLTDISNSIDRRADYELRTRSDGQQSKDFKQVENLLHPNVARLFVAYGIAADPYINAGEYDNAAKFEAASGLPFHAHTQNLKAYKKLSESADFLYSGGRLESVVKTVIACMIVSSRFHVVTSRDICESFLNANVLEHVSPELREALESRKDKEGNARNMRATHMTGGSPTQFSQTSLTLATMRAGVIHPCGNRKDFSLDLESDVVRSFAMRFGMLTDLKKAKEYRAREVKAGRAFA
jgi:hypothetical protein